MLLALQAAASSLDRARIAQLADRYIPAGQHPLDIEPETVQFRSNLGHHVVQELLPAPVLCGRNGECSAVFISMSSSM